MFPSFPSLTDYRPESNLHDFPFKYTLLTPWGLKAKNHYPFQHIEKSKKGKITHESILLLDILLSGLSLSFGSINMAASKAEYLKKYLSDYAEEKKKKKKRKIHGVPVKQTK